MVRNKIILVTMTLTFFLRLVCKTVCCKIVLEHAQNWQSNFANKINLPFLQWHCVTACIIYMEHDQSDSFNKFSGRSMNYFFGVLPVIPNGERTRLRISNITE
jgi:hypothetical protein